MKCVSCGTENPDKSKFCSRCGKGILAFQDQVPSNHHVGNNCPYCQTPIKPGVPVMVCPNCGIPHHSECWCDNGSKCTTFGCTGDLQSPRVNAPPVLQAPAQPEYSQQLQTGNFRQNSVQIAIPKESGSKKTFLWVAAATLIVALGFGAFSFLDLGKPKGSITADEVILRDNPSIGAKNVGELVRGDKVKIQEEWKSNDPNQAVISKEGLTIEYKGTPLKIQRGQAVVIDGQNGNEYVVRFNVDKQWITYSVNSSWVRKIAGEVWYRVRTERTGEGWVFGEFIRVEK